MSVITDPQVIKFVNEELRPACDRLVSALRTARQLSADYSAGGLGALVAGTSPLQQSYVADGSTNPDGTKGDGRTQLLGYDVDLCVGQVNALVAWIATQSGMEAAVTKPSVNTLPVF